MFVQITFEILNWKRAEMAYMAFLIINACDKE